MQKPNVARCRKSLDNAVSRSSSSNYPAIIDGFAAMGIPAEKVFPRENVFTFNAWIALGRQVCEGAQAVVVLTYVGCRGGRAKAGAAGRVRPVLTQLYHISQTAPVPAAASIQH